MNKKVELLCPAGNIDSFKAACQNGADAIYMGIGKYNARVMAKNFDIDEYIECIKYAHLRRIKVFLTLNTLMYDNEIKEALNLVLKLYSKGLDAVIVQDIGLASLIHKIIPSLPIHASTQMSVYSLEQVKFLEHLGFKRVVLARELTLNEIEYICKNTNLEIEVFVHGALCVSYSGQCLFSSTIGNRSANRGNCAQPCRMKYTLCNSKDEEIEKNRYLLSKKDICGLEYIKKLIDIGVYSLKIEGRNKVPEYVACVASIYRKNIDKILNNKYDIVSDEDKYVLKQIFNRNGLSTGYLDGVKKKESITDLSPKNTGLYLGKVMYKKGKIIKIKVMEDIDLHDGIEIYSKDGNISSGIVSYIKDESGNIQNMKIKKGGYAYIGDINGKFTVGDEVYKTSSNELNNKLKSTYVNDVQNKNIDVNVELIIKKAKNVVVSYYLESNKYSVEIDYVPDIAINKTTTIEQIQNNFTKTNNIPYNYKLIKCELDDGLFIPVSKINSIRNAIYENICKLLDVNIDVKKEQKLIDEILNNKNNFKSIDTTNNKKIYIYRYNEKIDYLKKYNNPTEIFIPLTELYRYEDDIYNNYSNIKINIGINNITGKNIDKYILDNIERLVQKFKVNGIVLGSYKFLELVKEIKTRYPDLKIIADYSLNITNTHSALFIKSIGFDELILTGEQEKDIIESISKVIKTNVLNGQICVMTSRYCILGSFVKGKKYSKTKNCFMPCLNDRYHIKDSHGYNYDLVCDNIDCIMKIFRHVKSGTEKVDNIISIV